jgi:hypothetical protein
MSRVVQPAKLVNETKIYAWDFNLAAGETISTASCAATVFSGTDATPSALISGSSTISGAKVTQKLTDGTLGVIYQVLCTITTSLGQTLKLMSYIAIVPDNE